MAFTASPVGLPKPARCARRAALLAAALMVGLACLACTRQLGPALVLSTKQASCSPANSSCCLPTDCNDPCCHDNQLPGWQKSWANATGRWFDLGAAANTTTVPTAAPTASSTVKQAAVATVPEAKNVRDAIHAKVRSRTYHFSFPAAPLAHR